MASMSLPQSGVIYVDSQILIYTVEKHPRYLPLLDPLWTAYRSQSIQVASSELMILETLVHPIRRRDETLELGYRTLLFRSRMRLLPIDTRVLMEAARLRTDMPSLRAADAIHLTTAMHIGAALFVTNDLTFRAAASLNVVIVDDLLA